MPESPPSTSIGLWPRMAWYSAPMALPRPGELWICATATFFVARAYASAAMMATDSCKVRM